MSRGALAAAAATAALLAGGCQSQWYLERTHREIVRTHLVVRTEPEGALVLLNGKRMDRSPVRIPIDYEHVAEQWSRQSNYGSRMRENSEGVETVLLAPVWIGASAVHGREERIRHVYELNEYEVRAILDGHTDALERVVLEGQAEVEVTLRLTRPAR